MFMFKSTLLISALVSTATATLPIYTLTDNFVGPSFLSGFNWEAIPDPTHGAVNYTDQAFAIQQNLTFTSHDTLILRADSTHTTNYPTGPGRNSVRIRSNKLYSNTVTIMNLRHMPVGCGTWPAFWSTLEADWPDSGEVDIIEGVNDVSPNLSSLHTSANCTMVASTMSQTGNIVSADCYGGDNNGAGCGIQATKANSYGPPLNSIGGGWYAMERTAQHINIWFWGRDEKGVPVDVLLGSPIVDPSLWGTPTANFVSTNCDFATHFGPHNIIINLTLCGDWAGNVYPSTCPSTCIDHVNNDPAAFVDAYWDIASVKVFEPVNITIPTVSIPKIPIPTGHVKHRRARDHGRSHLL
ncbi:hypothetical protein FRB94_012586 [Tulasnella sp. JGI-2019a]|nr:hypothetical protein FRB93_001451 [Tulasnella sp. JGI-2019a]KAG9009062.1 hypothetical protein FRB94_012586 [Tulasnella sp. JGI-2019a]KAG9030471.1 hypothetical protein FRB95_003920 [Tulasnella sp. JGI-2019a]